MRVVKLRALPARLLLHQVPPSSLLLAALFYSILPLYFLLPTPRPVPLNLFAAIQYTMWVAWLRLSLAHIPLLLCILVKITMVVAATTCQQALEPCLCMQHTRLLLPKLHLLRDRPLAGC